MLSWIYVFFWQPEALVWTLAFCVTTDGDSWGPQWYKCLCIFWCSVIQEHSCISDMATFSWYRCLLCSAASWTYGPPRALFELFSATSEHVTWCILTFKYFRWNCKTLLEGLIFFPILKERGDFCFKFKPNETLDIMCHRKSYVIFFLSSRRQSTQSADARTLSYHGGGKHSQMAEEGR